MSWTCMGLNGPLALQQEVTVEPRFNEVLGVKNEFLYPSNNKIYQKDLDITKPREMKASKFDQSLGPSLYRGSTVEVYKSLNVELCLDISFDFADFTINWILLLAYVTFWNHSWADRIKSKIIAKGFWTISLKSRATIGSPRMEPW